MSESADEELIAAVKARNTGALVRALIDGANPRTVDRETGKCAIVLARERGDSQHLLIAMNPFDRESASYQGIEAEEWERQHLRDLSRNVATAMNANVPTAQSLGSGDPLLPATRRLGCMIGLIGGAIYLLVDWLRS